MIKTKVLSNGMRVAFEKMSYLRTVSFGLFIKVGSANETVSNNGISHMIEHMLFKGTTNRNAIEIAKDSAQIGGNLNAYTTKEYTAFYITTLDEHLEKAIDLLADMIMNSTFTREDIEKEKGVISEEIDMYEDSPEDLVHEMLQKTIWDNHPLGMIISGTKEGISRFTREEIISYKDKYYTADNIVASVAGNFSQEKVVDIMEQLFAKLPKKSFVETISKPQYKKVDFRLPKDIEQVYMNIAFDAVDYMSKQKYEFIVANSILGGSENSRLFQVIREEQALTYSIYSYSCMYENTGLLHIDAVLNPAKFSLVYDAIMDVVNGIKENGVSQEELQQAKEQLKTELLIDNESTKTRMDANGKAIMQYNNIISADELIELVEKVSLNEVHEYVKRYLNEPSISLVGNIQN